MIFNIHESFDLKTDIEKLKTNNSDTVSIVKSSQIEEISRYPFSNIFVVPLAISDEELTFLKNFILGNFDTDRSFTYSAYLNEILPPVEHSITKINFFAFIINILRNIHNLF